MKQESANRDFVFTSRRTCAGVKSQHRRRKSKTLSTCSKSRSIAMSALRTLPYGGAQECRVGASTCVRNRHCYCWMNLHPGLNNEETDDISFYLEDVKHDLGVTLVMVEHDMNLVGQVPRRIASWRLTMGACWPSAHLTRFARIPEVQRSVPRRRRHERAGARAAQYRDLLRSDHGYSRCQSERSTKARSSPCWAPMVRARRHCLKTASRRPRQYSKGQVLLDGE